MNQELNINNEANVESNVNLRGLLEYYFHFWPWFLLGLIISISIAFLNLRYSNFQNKYYNNFTIHGVLGASNNFLLANKIKLKIDIGAIIGWDMYQGNQDILPNLSFGLVNEF